MVGRSTTIRRSLIGRMALLLAVTGGAIFVATWISAQKTVEDFSGLLIEPMTQRISAELDQFFGDVHHEVLLGLGWAEREALDATDDEALNAIFVPILEQHPQISSMMVANSDGVEYLLFRDALNPTVWHNRVVRADEWGTQVFNRRWDTATGEVEEGFDELDYDPRHRIWYQEALETTEEMTVIWTEPLIFSMTRDPGITAAGHLDRPGGVEGREPSTVVVAFDLLLLDISRITSELHVSENGRAFVLVERDGEEEMLVVGPEATVVDSEARLPSITELQVPELEDLIWVWEQMGRPERPFAYESGDADWLAGVRPYHLGGNTFWIGVAVPSTDLLGSVQIQRRALWVGVLIILIVGIAGTVTLARRFSKPIEALVKAAQRMRSGDFRAATPVRSKVLEFRRLAEAQESMREGLEARLKLTEVESKLRESQRVAHVGSWWWDVKTGEVEWSEEVYRIFQLSPKVFVPTMDATLSLSPWTEEHDDQESIRGALAAGEQGSYERKFVRPDGTAGHYLSTFAGVFDDEGELVAVKGTVQDTTDRKLTEEKQAELEAQLRHSQKLEAVGRLAGGVAHDFNNLLTAILGYSELSLLRLREEIGPEHNAVNALEQIQNGAERAAVLTRQLLTFSRRDMPQPKVLNLNHVVEDLDKMLRRLISADITIEINTAPDLKAIEADVGHLELVIVNLTVNAADAMAGGGQLTLQTENVTVDEEPENLHPRAQPGTYVKLTVIDTGVGMEASVVERIFEPFFTTKPRDEGTGLGLATVHGIVSQTGGYVVVDSVVGKGTRFEVYFPAVEVAPTNKDVVEVAESALWGDEVILLCEDDDAVREPIAEMLRSVGYDVTVASTGNEGLAAAKDRQFDLLIADVIMPDMNGREASERLRKLQPSLEILFISGYSANILMRQGVLEENTHFLAKPFTRTTFLRKLRAVLGPGM